ncbi:MULTISPECIES: TetR/AcrR family transcriptional regulator [unclassified Clostridioides]|uniref:TetR/AcrR family transcriptional regulator n=1 Tax=unclassified Clostridioides TaxID=2635829 RepID=UPI001D0C6FAB|nr:TetR/AcrR family transcriptional regulator [Clostridioides sp. ES-S-0001-02]MCC0653460.1 TetR/AcrR family transcriptional regulator [Clostridioides sp. ES-S-0001-03]MCC0656522.1 TetR/AcrR family transcriptional regulator [Clostridioides sp. ES-S-0123-01]MCC0671931.1 TetR/AcrR family transcriptional regulator [Clostridioides sp. ES-S-0145-01]MCC0695787.1 TetR/AcrR family transcriptional regulator [Clostridioides sp. ES-S-0048-02]MCC0704498.1 TetR/AcrR family transcriptional regulator [Clostr
MKIDSKKEQLINTTVQLLTSNRDISSITAREIIAKANVNLAMINYYFKSKEALINTAIKRILKCHMDEYKTTHDKQNLTPKQELKEMLMTFCDVIILYSQFIEISVPYILVQEDIIYPFEILPLIRAHYKNHDNNKTEEDYKVIAYQITSFIQLVLLRSNAFLRYSGIDIMDAEKRSALIDSQLELFLIDTIK